MNLYRTDWFETGISICSYNEVQKPERLADIFRRLERKPYLKDAINRRLEDFFRRLEAISGGRKLLLTVGGLLLCGTKSLLFDNDFVLCSEGKLLYAGTLGIKGDELIRETGFSLNRRK